jgi:hypothetical protein
LTLAASGTIHWQRNVGTYCSLNVQRKKERKEEKSKIKKKKKKKIIRVFFQTERIEKVHKRCMLQRRKLRRNKSEPGDGEKESETEHFKQTAGRQSWW